MGSGVERSSLTMIGSGVGIILGDDDFGYKNLGLYAKTVLDN